MTDNDKGTLALTIVLMLILFGASFIIGYLLAQQSRVNDYVRCLDRHSDIAKPFDYCVLPK